MTAGSNHTPVPPRLLQIDTADAAAVRRELAAGLLAPNSSIAPKFLYDALGSRLFEAITELTEYYPTRTEALIFAARRDAMAAACGHGHTLVDLGAGNCAKAASLFDALQPSAYVAVDISVDFLRGALHDLKLRHPGLPMLGVGTDFSRALVLPPEAGDGERVVFYPGSSIGNFTPEQALHFLRQMRLAAQGGSVLVGVDLVKPLPVLELAYDDPLGVTAAFNLNLLRNVNRLLKADLDVADWKHVAFFNAAESRIEMHLQARRDLLVRWPGTERAFRAGERIHTENSYKYRVESFDDLLQRAGFARRQHWTDGRGWFAVFHAAD